MDARVACLRSRSCSIAIGSSRISRVNTAASKAVRLCRRPRLILAKNAANDGDLDPLSSLAPPDIDGDVASAYADAGGRFDPATGVATTFNGNDQQALDASTQGVAVADRSHCRRIRISGRGRFAFLHGQATNDFGGSGLVEYGGSGVAPPAPGDVLPTVVFALPDGKVRDFGTAFVTADGILLQASPWFGGGKEEGEEEEEEEEEGWRRGGTQKVGKPDPSDLLAALDSCVFSGDEVSISDVTGETASFSLLGPGAASALAALGAPDAGALPRGKMMLLGGGGGGGSNEARSRSPVLVARGGGLYESGDGFTLILDRAAAPDLWRALVAVGGAEPMGEDAWERARVLAGRPAAGREVGAGVAATALEAGLCGAVSVRKGCYVGQEALAKAAAAGRLKQQLWGLRLVVDGEAGGGGGDEEGGILAAGSTLWPAPAPSPGGEGGEEAPSSSSPNRGAPAGRITSVAADADGNAFALAYVSSTGRAGAERLSEGLEVAVESAAGGDGRRSRRARARLVDLPFASRELPERAATAAGEEESAPSVVAPNDRGGKEARLAAMKARLEAYQRGEAAQE